MLKRGRKPAMHPDGCACEKCYKFFCAENGMKYEKKR